MNKLDPFSPKLMPQFSAGPEHVPAQQRDSLVEPKVPVTAPQTTNFHSAVRRTRGRPKKGPLPEVA